VLDLREVAVAGTDSRAVLTELRDDPSGSVGAAATREDRSAIAADAVRDRVDRLSIVVTGGDRKNAATLGYWSFDLQEAP